MADAYHLEQVRFAYPGSPTALSIDNLHLAAGQIHVLLGPNGSGKTTLLHLLAFLLFPSEGHLSFWGKKVKKNGCTHLRRRIGLLLQKPYLFNTTVLENVTCGLKMRGENRAKRQRRALEYLAQLGLSHLASRPAASLSGGEVQRVALARTLVLEPEVLLLDEVFNHLDHSSLHHTMKMLQYLNRECKVTVILTTHDLLQGQILGDRIHSLINGRLAPTPMTNHFEVEREQNGGCFHCGPLRFHLPEGLEKGRHLIIDPNQIVLSKTPLISSMRNIFAGTVNTTTEHGGKIRVEIDAGLLFYAVVTRESWHLLGLHPGDKVWIQFKSTAIKVF